MFAITRDLCHRKGVFMDGNTNNVKIFVDKRSISYQKSCLESAMIGLLKQIFPDSPQWWGFGEVMLMLEILRDPDGYAIVNNIFSVFALEKTDVFATGCWNDFCSVNAFVRMETIDSLYAKLRKILVPDDMEVCILYETVRRYNEELNENVHDSSYLCRVSFIQVEPPKEEVLPW